MSATVITTGQHCGNCARPLTLEEMHYYDLGDGTANCTCCEKAWSEQVAAYRRGEREDFPELRKDDYGDV